MPSARMNLDAEWLEPDGRGGFASGTVGGARSRRYHALLLPATQPPVARMALVNGLEIWLQTAAGRYPLSTQRYTGSDGDNNPGVLAPRGQDFLSDFHADPWPRWTFSFPDGTRVEQELFVHRATGVTALGWRLLNPSEGNADARLELRPLLSGRDYHALHKENGAFAFAPVLQDNGPGNCLWRPYDGVPGVRVWSSGTYRHDPQWYRNFLYLDERERGLDDTEDLAVPGVFTCELGRDAVAVLLLASEPAAPTEPPFPANASAAKLLPGLRADEDRRRAALGDDPLRRAGDAYIVRGGRGTTIIAGYPWFTDWGRDTFISMRGLCLAAGRFEEAREILLHWAGAVSQGMLPNRFPDGGDPPEYNTVDAALWFVVAAHDYLTLVPLPVQSGDAASERLAGDQAALLQTCDAILTGYAAGTRYGIRLDPDDGLLFAGEPGVALTWMDARINGGHAVTPRIGKPVEIQALWLNALYLQSSHAPRWRLLYEKARVQFERKFWNAGRGCLFDVIDTDGHAGQNDASLRPNQIFAVGGLPLVLLSSAQARAVVETVERELLTPGGLRTLARGEPGYCGHYTGGPTQRDSAYHQGTVWPWLLGPFVEAWVRVRGDTQPVRDEAWMHFAVPWLEAMPFAAGLDHLPEITDAEPPFAPKGCPFQAWSVGEISRLAWGVLR